MNSEWLKKENESTYEYIKRMVLAKIDGTYTGTYSEWIKYVFGKEHSEDVSRREYYGCKMLILSTEEDDVLNLKQERDNEILFEEIKKREVEIDKKRVKLADEFSYLSRLKREIARIETIGEYAMMAAQALNEVHPLINTEVSEIKTDSNKGILCLSDWHYGLVCNHLINVYNPDIARLRINKLIDVVIDDIHKFNIDEIVVANLGDLLSGIIHTTIRLENRVDIVSQTIETSELLAELLDKLSKEAHVRYYSVIDNHGRVFANKEESLDKENFNRMIDFYLKERCKNNENIEINDNSIDESIMEFVINGWGVVGVHGHDDKPSEAVQYLSNMLHADYSMCLIGHYHSPNFREDYGKITVTNGCLCGSDEYAKKVRRTSRPSQNFIVVSENNPCEFLHTIIL